MKTRNLFILMTIIVGFLVTGCTGLQTFTTAARPGDTIALTMGWNQELSRDDLTVTITPAIGDPVTYLPGNPAVRALINLHPDPISRLIVERETGDFSDNGYFYSVLMENTVTGPDKDFFQKVLLMDLPSGIASGTAAVSFSSSGGESLPSQYVEILSGTGTRNNFQIQEGLSPTLGQQLVLAERASHYTVSFSGTVVPHAIQVDLTHDADESLGGTGVPYVVSTRGADKKGAYWSDDGSSMRVILIPNNSALGDLVNFKFYIAGGLQNLQVASVSAYDIDGNPVSGVNAAVSSFP